MSLVFHIGLAGLGQDWLAETFRMNGYTALNWLRGQLAEELAFARLEGIMPGEGSFLPELAAFPDGSFPALIAGLDGAPPAYRPRVEMAQHFRAFRRWFPKAVFMLPQRDEADWLNARLALRGGSFARAEARQRGVEIAALPEVWLAERAALEADAMRVFGADPHFLRPDLDAGMGAMADALAPFVALPRHAPDPPEAMLVPIPMPPRLRPRPRDAAFVEDLTRFCLGREVSDGTGLCGCSPLYGRWDGARRVMRRDGAHWPIRFDEGTGQFHARPGVPKLERIEGLMNEVISLGRSGWMDIDLQDARLIGTAPDRTPLRRTVTYCRREGAAQAVLWPLPGYHTPGDISFPGGAPPDDLRFEDKLDRVAWRGNLAGSEWRNDNEPSKPAHVLMREVLGAKTAPDQRAAAWGRLYTTARFGTLLRHRGDPDTDFGFVPSRVLDPAAHLPELAPFMRPREGIGWLRRHRYVLSVGGTDVGSNFLMAANSRSVVLKEEEGWEVFYTGLFRPWEHYIPLAPRCTDLTAKLDWARANPGKCKRMSRAARAVCAQLADATMRAEVLNGVLDGLWTQ